MDAAVMTNPEFRTFYEGWSSTESLNLNEIRDKLKAVAESGRRPPQKELKVFVDKIMEHICVYHDKKVQAATSETSAVSAGIWKTPLEAGFIWLGGWRPAAAIMLAYSLMGMQIENELQALLNGVDVPSMAALSHRQLSALNDLQQTTKDLEGNLSDRLAHLQMMLAGEEMTKAASMDDSEGVDMDGLDKAMDKKLEDLRDLLIDADKLRLETLHQMVAILTPMQSAQFLVAAIELSMAIRELGLMKMESHGGDGSELQAPKYFEELHRVAAKGQTAALEKLVQEGANVSTLDYEGRTPLHLAAFKGHTASVSLLIKMGADVNVFDERGSTPILYAVKGGHEKAAKLLLEAGAKVAASDVGVELCRAAASGNLEYLRRLVQSAKCNPNTVDYDRRTPLHLAAAEGIYPAVDILLKAGGDALAKDRHDFTPLDEAIRSKKWLVVELLNLYVPPEHQVSVEGFSSKELDHDMEDDEESEPVLADGPRAS